MLLFSLSPTISYGTIYDTTGHFIDEGQEYPGTNGYAVSLWDLEEENVCKRSLMVIDNFVIWFIDRLLLLAAMIASFFVVDNQKCDLIDCCYQYLRERESAGNFSVLGFGSMSVISDR